MMGTGLLGKPEDDEAEAPMPEEDEAEAPPAAEPDAAAGGEETPNVTPEEQAQYDEFVNNAMSMIYDPKVRTKILDSLRVTKQPMDDLANTAVMVVKGAVGSAEKAGQKISDDVLYHGGAEILQQLAEYADKAKIHTFTEDEMEGAWYKALDLYRQLGTNDGTINPDALKGEFQQIVDADKAGTLDQIVPGVGQQQGAAAPATEA